MSVKIKKNISAKRVIIGILQHAAAKMVNMQEVLVIQYLCAMNYRRNKKRFNRNVSNKKYSNKMYFKNFLHFTSLFIDYNNILVAVLSIYLIKHDQSKKNYHLFTTPAN